MGRNVQRARFQTVIKCRMEVVAGEGHPDDDEASGEQEMRTNHRRN